MGELDGNGKKPTIDERLEALVQTVEHLALQGEEQNKRIDKIVGAIEGLARIAELHERRIEKLEG